MKRGSKKSLRGQLFLSLSLSAPLRLPCAAALKKYEYCWEELLPSILAFFQRSGAEKGAATQRRKDDFFLDF